MFSRVLILHMMQRYMCHHVSPSCNFHHLRRIHVQILPIVFQAHPSDGCSNQVQTSQLTMFVFQCIYIMVNKKNVIPWGKHNHFRPFVNDAHACSFLNSRRV